MKIILGFLLLLIASCATQKRCFEKFPPQVITKDSIILKDTTIYVKQRIFIPGDSVLISDTIPCPDVEYHKEAKSTLGKTTAKVDISKGRLTVDCKVDSLNKIIDSLKVQLQTKEAYHKEVQVVEKPVEKTPLWVWYTFGVIGLMLILFLIKRLK
jgi:hypothetical protein